MPRREIGGVYPHLACFNDEAECGIGAVVPWANRLWVPYAAPALCRARHRNTIFSGVWLLLDPVHKFR
jgi:hypothetical protein